MTDTSNLVFLPWLRRGGATALGAPDSLGAGQPGVAAAKASVAVNDAAPITVDVRLMGPGHVTGLQVGQVIRTDPTPGSRAFEPNYCPLVEFDEPSLPWLFTPAAADDSQRLRPWLCLVVVRKQPGVQLSPPRRGALPVLTIGAPADPNAELPDLSASWAWAHAQLTGELPPRGPAGEDDRSVAAMTRLLQERPDRTLSRLVCGRVLTAATDYLACVVPTFELGRLAGLGEDITAEEEASLRPAWTLGEALRFVELPVYHSWEFATGPNGDFQSLAMLLRARDLPEGVGQRPIDISTSGVPVAVPDGSTLPLGGALRPVTPAASEESPAALPPASPWPTEALHDSFRTELAAILDAPDAMPAETPLLAPPRYGATQSGHRQLDPGRRDRWYEQLNLEPMARATAQFGTRLVQDQQEALVASAWEQAAELERVNTLLRHAQFGMAMGASLHRRHLSRMTPDVGLQVLAPAQAQLALTAAANRPDTGLVALLQVARVPAAAFGIAMRRIARPQGAIVRRVARTAAASSAPRSPASASLAAQPAPARSGSVLRSLQPDFVFARFDGGTGIVGPPIDQMVTIERVALGLIPQRTDIAWDEASAAAVAGAPPRPFFELRPFTQPGTVPPVVTPPPVRPVDPTPTPPRPRPRPLPPRPFPTDPGRPRPVEPFARLRPIDDGGDPFPFPDPEPEPEPEPEPDPIPDPVLRDSAAAATFRIVAAAHLQRFDPRPPQPPRDAFPTVELSVVYAEALARIEPAETFAARVGVLIDRRSAAPQPGGPTAAELDPTAFTPRFPQPLAPALAAMDQDLMLPGLDKVPPNTVVPLETNSSFVDAVMVGFNAELGHELVWREFPTPLQATYADRFWDPGAADRPPDIPPLAEWADRPLGGGRAGAERFVVMLRSELLRRYPDAVVYATRPDTPPAMPILTGSMAPDVRFFGFDIPAADIGAWSIVIAEQPTAPRFGVEVDEVPAGAAHLALTAADGDAAALASRLRQQPVQVTIPASVLLREA
jgi:hypothetical protein